VPLPGALAAVRGLRDRGVRLALLTNGEAGEQRRKIERFQLAPLFECVLVEGEFGVGKPEEAVYRHALAALDATPADAWMVGDNLEWEVVVPQRLGMYAVWVDHAGRGLPPDSLVRPDRTVRSISELLEP
jgi:putative hydrolase of the HAD superfamily